MLPNSHCPAHNASHVYIIHVRATIGLWHCLSRTQIGLDTYVCIQDTFNNLLMFVRRFAYVYCFCFYFSQSFSFIRSQNRDDGSIIVINTKARYFMMRINILFLMWIEQLKCNFSLRWINFLKYAVFCWYILCLFQPYPNS